MQRVQFSIYIEAPRKKVWDIMLGEATYAEWTAPFGGGNSRFEGNWDKGSKILFVGPDSETGKDMGMVSQVAESTPYEFVSIKHVGIVANGIEDTTSEQAREWSPAFENYTFAEKGDGTELTVDIDLNDKYIDDFKTMWPLALAKLKEAAERP